ncbi:MAG TPA: DUF3667 domain-containing protein [Pseudomonadales bacterium]|nr:DUF3667 domain-containing protein [Pseudomonadales bacterium]
MDNEPTTGNTTQQAQGTCPNCGAQLRGEWCFECGQKQNSVDKFFFTLVHELLEDVLAWDSRASRTLIALMLKPGFLTREYFAARRARYVPPLRLYLICSVVFFFAVNLESFITPPHPVIQIYRPTAAQGDQAKALPDSRKTIEQLADSLNFTFLSAASNQIIRSRVKSQLTKAADLMKNNPRELTNAILNVAPPVMFLLVPLFAVFLKLVYVDTGRYYMEHLIFAVHNHSFLFIALILRICFSYLGILWPTIQHMGTDLISLWIVIYMYWSLITYYGQGYLVTLVKFSVLTVGYFILFGVGVSSSVMLGIMSL